MNTLLILWGIALAACDKLDRTYLPPPGYITAGGQPGDLNLPLENQQPNYSVEPGRNTVIDNALIDVDYPNVAIGIDRKGPLQAISGEPIYTFPSNTYNIPVTTTSYAFTQTTTLSPVETINPAVGQVGFINEGFSSTISPFNPTPEISYDQYISQQIINPQNPQITGPILDSNIFDSLPQDREDGNLSQNVSPELVTGRVQIPKGVGIPVFGDYISNGDESFPTNLTRSYYESNNDNQSTLPSDINNDPQARENLQYAYPQSSVLNDSSRFIQYSSDPSDSGSSPKSVSNQNTVGISTSKTVPSVESATSTYTSNNVQPERFRAEADRNAAIINYENRLTPEGFAYSFDTSNGIHADESGTAVNGVKAHGSYSYTGDDGKVYSVVYTADENGFLPYGDHLPTAPAIPDAILKVIEQANINKKLGIFDDGSYDDKKYGHDRYQGLMGNFKQELVSNVFEKQTPNTQGSPSSVRSSFERDDLLAGTGKRTGDIVTKDLVLGKKLRNDGKIINEDSLLTSYENEEGNVKAMLANAPTDDIEKSETVKVSPDNFSRDKDQFMQAGYEYLHPINQFNDNNKLQSRFSGDIPEDGESKSKSDRVTPKPFITPNVSFNFKTNDSRLNSQNFDQSSKTPVSSELRNQNDNKGLDQIDDEDEEDMDRAVNGPTNYKSTDSKYYEAPFTSTLIENERDQDNYFTSTSALPSDISSRLTSSINTVDYSSTPKSSMPRFSTTLQSADISNTLPSGLSSRQPIDKEINNKLGSVDGRLATPITTGAPDYRINMPGYRGRPKIPVIRTGLSDGLKPRFGVSNTKSQSSPDSSRVSRPIDSVTKSSTEKVIGEDFSGPKQIERFDPEHGYYY